MVWNYLDDAYATSPNQLNVNEAFTRLGVEYADYVKHGGTPLPDVVAKYTPDGADLGSNPDRVQSLHDNLLGNLTSDALTQRYGATALHDTLQTLIIGVDAHLLNRPYGSGDEGTTGVADAHVQAARLKASAHGSSLFSTPGCRRQPPRTESARP